MDLNRTHQILLSADRVNKDHVAGYMNTYRENSAYTYIGICGITILQMLRNTAKLKYLKKMARKKKYVLNKLRLNFSFYFVCMRKLSCHPNGKFKI